MGAPTDIEGSWDVTAFNNGSAIVSVALGSTITMVFDADGQVSGNGGCNQYSGGYSVDGNNISIGPLRSTMMACPDQAVGTQESQFLAALDMVRPGRLPVSSSCCTGRARRSWSTQMRAPARSNDESRHLGRKLARPARLELTTF